MTKKNLMRPMWFASSVLFTTLGYTVEEADQVVEEHLAPVLTTYLASHGPRLVRARGHEPRAKLVGWLEQGRRVPRRRTGTRVTSLESAPPRDKAYGTDRHNRLCSC